MSAWGLLPWDGLSPCHCHLRGNVCITGNLDALDAGCPVRIQYDTDDPRKKSVVFFADFRIGSGTIGAASQVVLLATISDGAPACLFIPGAPRTFAGEIGAACSAIEAATGDQLLIGHDFFWLKRFHWLFLRRFSAKMVGRVSFSHSGSCF